MSAQLAVTAPKGRVALPKTDGNLCELAIFRVDKDRREICKRAAQAIENARKYRHLALENGDTSSASGYRGKAKRSKNSHLTTSAAATSMESSASAPLAIQKRLREPIAIDVIERVDLVALNWINKHRTRLFKSQGEATRFERYAEMAQASGGEYRVRFRQRAHGVGRMYADGSMSLANINRRARAGLAKAYADIDMSNAHPTILLATAQRHGWATPELQRVVARREEVYALFPCARKIAKRIILSTIMGGSAMTVLRKENLEHLRFKMPVFASKFAHEIKMLRRLIYDNYRQLHCAIGADRRNPAASCLSFFLQEEELKVLLTAREHLLQQEHEVGPLIYDGLLVVKDEKRPIGAVQLAALRTNVHKKTKYDIPFTIKEFTGGFEDCP